MLYQKKSFKRLTPKFQGDSNGAIFDIKFSICIAPEVEQEVTSPTLKIKYLKH